MWFVLACASAISFGLRGILYQWSSKQSLNRNLMLLGVYISGTIITVTGSLLLGETWSPAVWVGALMGLFSFISNAAMYKGYSVGKASLIAMFTGLPPVVVALLAFTVWGERLSSGQLLAFVVIMTGLMMVRYSGDLSLRNLQGAQWGVLTMLFFGLTDFFTKQATLLHAATFPTLTMMYATGGLLFGATWLLDLRKTKAAQSSLLLARQESAAASEAGPSASIADHAEATPGEAVMAAALKESAAGTEGEAKASASSEITPPRKPWTIKRTLLWGMTVGITNACGMMFAMPAFKLGVTGLVSAVMAANVVLVMLYARFVLRESFKRLEAVGMAIGFAGIVLLKLLS
ncbi:DMT family transporter [Paenibacillus puerhi]|uniref:DMT family transporter n=1 Tax=Paenibacillus puerhi TaxID=2692622 RepID=UPI00135AE24A|nr:DMT family transporter [Paenibacillus puerhi]